MLRIHRPRLSLAVKYRILFGGAVALIIGAALSLPWFIVEALAFEQSFNEARRAADDYFRLALAAPDEASLMTTHGKEASLLPESFHHQPRFLPLIRDLDSVEAAGDAGDPLESFSRKALRTFLRFPKQDSTNARIETGYGTRFAYSHAVRAQQSCLQCHGEAGRARSKYRENELIGAVTVDLPAAQSEKYLLIYRLGILAAGALAGILAILVFYIITHRFILAPIEELRNVAEKVEKGDAAARATLKTGDEFETLAESLNAMLEKLRSQQDELRVANKLLDEKLGELAQVNVSLYESNRVKSEFLANVSHELRTPLTSIIGFAELLRDNAANGLNGKIGRYTDNILISGRILMEIINDLLDLAKIEAGKVVLRLESVHIGELCNTLLDFLRPMGDKKNLVIAYEADSELPILITDRGRVRQILYNLLSNAIKFTPEGGGVTLRCKREPDGGVRLEVADTGPGIAPEHQAIIFEKFRQIDGSATREHYGTGLGLAIAKELAELLGGSIGLDSTLGVGSVFRVHLPPVTAESGSRPMVSLV